MQSLNFFETLLVFAIAIWMFCLAMAYITGNKKPFLDWSKKTIIGLWKKWWRYIIIFVIGYSLGRESSFRLTTHFYGA